MCPGKGGDGRRYEPERMLQSLTEQMAKRSGVEYMRSKYCLRHELGLCPKQGKVKAAEPLLLRNGKQRLRLHFHCTTCEMTVE